MKDYSLGLVSVSFRGHTPQTIIEAAAAAGLSCIEWGSDVHARPTDKEGLRQIAERQREYGLVTSSYGTYFRLGVTPQDELSSYIEAARLLGTDTLRLWCGQKSGAEMTEKEREELTALCRGAAAMAEAHGVRLCMECHKRTLTENPEDAVRLIEEVASPAFSMYWQPFQWQGVSENLANAARVAPYAHHIHVFHWRGDERLPLAEATDEWRAYLAAFTTPRTLLLEFMPRDGIEELAAEADSLRRIAE